MGFLWALAFFCLLTLSSSFQPNNSESQKYIIRVRNDLKPSIFSDVEHWYRSTLRSLSSSLEFQRFEDTDFVHVYKNVFHGFSAELTPRQAELIKTRQEVLAVYPNRILQLHTTHSPQFLGLINVNNTPIPNGLIEESDYGSNVIIGVLDSGVWPETRSYNDNGLDSIPSHWKGECVEDHNFTKSHCNKKLIGARFFGSELISRYSSVRDYLGHGTHTSSTAAGSEVLNASLFGFAPGIASGVARKARIAVYKICWSAISCSTEDIIAAYDKAVEDGVDIISFSIGGGVLPYHLDPITIAQFGAMENNVLVSASAGNDGPSSTSVTNIPPWITTVGAGTIDRRFPSDLILADGTILTGVSLYSGQALPQKTFFPLFYARNTSTNSSERYSGAICMPGSLDPKLVTGKIVICERGGLISRAEKGEVVKNASGVGMVLVNVGNMGENLFADVHILPSVAISVSTATTLFSYLASSKDPHATIVSRGTELNIKPAPVVASFSSRGPPLYSNSIIKPDLIAPGVEILAAWPDGVGFSPVISDKRNTDFYIMSGTSMACPHISGVAAMLKGAHPDWSPSRIKSAMMTTSYIVDNAGKHILDEATYNVSTPWDYGSGHVDPEKALDPGLVYDLTVTDYIDNLCASGYSEKNIATITRKMVRCKKGLKAWDINYPSIAVCFNQTDALKYETTVTRTATHVSKDASTYIIKIANPPDVLVTVEPSKLEFTQKEQKLSYVVKISTKKFDYPTSVFGRLTWENGKHSVGMPIVVTQS
ncbi:Subtilisin-like protease SBT1.5 [Thalictrum thalictroides]|uniref:Subtilisin-like protease SBT1.5 n=1 Tax=Thalictrum thalictroides TaxID=46969 RepID=A0A7J6W2L4_THATH|nr:Subtilisin-like protease SBT1.5 [Thalictrum thalictroides]